MLSVKEFFSSWKVMFTSPMIWVEVHFLTLCFVPLLFCMVPEAEWQPSREYVESLQQLKDVLGELEGKQHSMTSGLSEPSKVESALQQAKVTLPLSLKQGNYSTAITCCSPALFSVG